MKRSLSIFLTVMLVFTIIGSGFTISFSAVSVDAVTSATTWEEETPVTPVAPKVPATEQKVVAPVVTDGETYTVVAGDVMWRIATKHNLTLDRLVALNPQIKNPSLIYVGQKIIVGEKVADKVTETKTDVAGHFYPNGTYRGDFYDSGALQVVVQFTLKDNIVTNPSYRTLFYRDVDYRAEKEDAKVMAINAQFNELLQYMVGKDIETAVDALYSPAEIVADQLVGTDTITGATVRSSKVISAINNGLVRGLYSVGAPSITYENGTYRGTFSDGGYQQVGVQFTLADNNVTNASYRLLTYRDVDYRAEKEDLKVVAITNQFVGLLDYLKEKDIRIALSELYVPENIVEDAVVEADTLTGATVRSAKVISAINDGLKRGVYSYASGETPSPAIVNKNFENGTYRGSFIDGNQQQVGVQMTLENNIVTNISYRALAYKGVNYRTEREDKKIVAMNEQYNELIGFLTGKDIRSNFASLYWPGEIVSDKVVDVDTMTGATIRASKVTSAIMDALNRGPYSK
ncbi:MAG: LysM peptidoglycan-binding domain-containing protein [Clostridia bacterium]|nr:LysM peptidoglycan-binding domain-containing protein [Clostridia bacterium]